MGKLIQLNLKEVEVGFIRPESFSVIPAKPVLDLIGERESILDRRDACPTGITGSMIRTPTAE